MTQKWLKWKLIHKDGLTFNEYRIHNNIKLKDGTICDMSQPKTKYLWYEPLIFQSGYPCVYEHNYAYYCNSSVLHILDAKEWIIKRGANGQS